MLSESRVAIFLLIKTVKSGSLELCNWEMLQTCLALG